MEFVQIIQIVLIGIAVLGAAGLIFLLIRKNRK